MEKKLPKTSIDAYKSSKGLSARHRSLILDALGRLREATGEDIAATTKLDKHQVMRRMSELERSEEVLRTQKMKPTSTGRNAFVYIIRPEGWVEVGGQAPRPKRKRRKSKFKQLKLNFEA